MLLNLWNRLFPLQTDEQLVNISLQKIGQTAVELQAKGEMLSGKIEYEVAVHWKIRQLLEDRQRRNQ